MPALLRSLDDRIRVERGLFGLMDLEPEGEGEPWPAGAMPEDATVWAQDDRVDFRSPVPDHYVRVRMETWDRRPVAPAGDWEDTEEVELLLSSGEVELWELTGGPSPRSLNVGSGGRYRLETRSRGQRRLLERYMDSPSAALAEETEYLLRFWPSSPDEA